MQRGGGRRNRAEDAAAASLRSTHTGRLNAAEHARLEVGGEGTRAAAYYLVVVDTYLVVGTVPRYIDRNAARWYHVEPKVHHVAALHDAVLVDAYY